MEFEQRLDKILKEKNLVKEDSRPHTGIWYYLWFKPNWKLWTYPFYEGSKQPGHYELWQVLAEDIGHYYKLTADQISELQEAYMCMPRGRIDNTDILANNEFGKPVKTNKWFIFHGGDFPKPESAEIRKIISIFNLTGPELHGLTDKRIVDHEKTDGNHVAIAEALIGEIGK